MNNLKALEILVEEKREEIDVALEYEFSEKFEKVCEICSRFEISEGGDYYTIIIKKDDMYYRVSVNITNNGHKFSHFSVSDDMNFNMYYNTESSDADDIVHEINDWIYKRYNLMYATDYLHNQKNCILILLATKHKQFFGLPLDITKIITKKIMFFVVLFFIFYQTKKTKNKKT